MKIIHSITITITITLFRFRSVAGCKMSTCFLSHALSATINHLLICYRFTVSLYSILLFLLLVVNCRRASYRTRFHQAVF